MSLYGQLYISVFISPQKSSVYTASLNTALLLLVVRTQMVDHFQKQQTNTVQQCRATSHVQLATGKNRKEFFKKVVLYFDNVYT